MSPLVGLALLIVAMALGELGHQQRNPWLMLLSLTCIAGLMIATGFTHVS